MPRDNKRNRKITADDKVMIILLRGYGFSLEDIATRYNVRPETISYHLRQNKKEIEEDINRIFLSFTDILLESDLGFQNIVMGSLKRLWDEKQ